MSQQVKKLFEIRVLILCTGNSCRNQMAHGFLQSFDENLEVYFSGAGPTVQVNSKVMEMMKEVRINISSHIPTHVSAYINQGRGYVITVCGDANESYPTFIGEVRKRLRIGFDDPSHATGTLEFIDSEFRRVRNKIRSAFTRFYVTEIRKEVLSKCPCGGNY